MRVNAAICWEIYPRLSLWVWRCWRWHRQNNPRGPKQAVKGQFGFLTHCVTHNGTRTDLLQDEADFFRAHSLDRVTRVKVSGSLRFSTQPSSLVGNSQISLRCAHTTARAPTSRGAARSSEKSSEEKITGWPRRPSKTGSTTGAREE